MSQIDTQSIRQADKLSCSYNYKRHALSVPGKTGGPVLLEKRTKNAESEVRTLQAPEVLAFIQRTVTLK